MGGGSGGSGMTMRFAVVYEARSDFRTATELADRVLCESIDWLEPEHLEHQREWLTTSPDGHQLTWTGIGKIADARGIKAWGHFDEKPGLPDAQAARRALLCLKQIYPGLNGIVLIRDQDNQPRRRGGLIQARETFPGQAEVVIGLAIIEREAWGLSGFEPQCEQESNQLTSERKKVGFDPREKSHQLDAGSDDSATKSAKRVLNALLGQKQNPEREQQCWTVTPLQTLKARGKQNGLADYLSEVEGRLVPLLTTKKEL